MAPAHQAAASNLSMHVSVFPNPMSASTNQEYVRVATQPRIICVAFVLYDDGREPSSFEHAQTKVTGYDGTAIWRWHDTSAASGGTASVSCTSGPLTRTVTDHFRILPSPQGHGAAPTAPSAPRAFALRLFIAPNPMVYGTDPAKLTVYAPSGASCVAGIFYNNGQAPPSFSGVPETVAGGSAWWIWHEETQSNGGTAAVTCTYRGRVETATALFTVRH
jgi:hypothetical protein